MRYIGSKVATLPKLTELVARKAPGARSLCDPFAGTCTVARHFKSAGMRVSTGDLLSLSYAIQLATISLNSPPTFQRLLDAGFGGNGDCAPHEQVLSFLSALGGKAGHITENYSLSGTAKRLFFTIENAERIDAIRQTISRWRTQDLISIAEEAYLVASLIDAADRVANTAGTYYAYLKELDRKAIKPLELRPLPIFNNGQKNECWMGDAATLANQSDCDILYLDPPYNARNYAHYYHLPETIARWDCLDAAGRSGNPIARITPKSEFYRPQSAANALRHLIENAKARHIVVHYTTDGLMQDREIKSILEGRGKTTTDDFEVRGYSAKLEVAGKRTMHRVYWCTTEGAQDHATP